MEALSFASYVITNARTARATQSVLRATPPYTGHSRSEHVLEWQATTTLELLYVLPATHTASAIMVDWSITVEYAPRLNLECSRTSSVSARVATSNPVRRPAHIIITAAFPVQHLSQTAYPATTPIKRLSFRTPAPVIAVTSIMAEQPVLAAIAREPLAYQQQPTVWAATRASWLYWVGISASVRRRLIWTRRMGCAMLVMDTV